MKANSNNNPGDFTKSNTKTFVNYNIKEIEIIDPETKESRKVWDYDYVEIKGEVTKAKFKDALGNIEKDDVAWMPDSVVAEYMREK